MQANFELRTLNTLALPAKAKAFVRFSSQIELLGLLKKAKAEHTQVYVLGEGSNILLADDVDGLVIQSAMNSVQLIDQNAEHIWLAVDAGMNWHQWVQQSIQYGHGLENLALIPGSVGAAPIQNIGAYGVEVREYLEQVEGVEISTGKTRIIKEKDCHFSYRNSIFKHELKNDFIITRVVFRLSKQFSPNLTYGPLQKLTGLDADALIAAVCDIRRSKLPDPTVTPNAGSFFKNPIVDSEKVKELKRIFPELPQYLQADGQAKLAAGWLIEQAGWKGKWLGNVRMHDQQALVLTTNGKASFNEVMELKEAVVTSVQQLFGVTLEAEPQVFPN